MRRLKTLWAVPAIALAITAAACGSATPSATGASGVLTISNDNGGTWTCLFNPFNPNVSLLAFGPVYEPLAFVDVLRSGAASPWLASSWAWSKGNTVLTFTIRHGLHWQDGKPLTSADVVFTFGLLKKNPALDLNSDWTFLTSVTAQGADKVVMTFKSAGLPDFFYVAGQTPIVPEHIWSAIAKPVTFADSHPVGSGAYTVGACTPQNITYTANKHYWQPGEPKVAKVLYPAFTSNNPANDELASGQAQWGEQFIPDIQKFYADKSTANKYWFPPVSNNYLWINLKDPLLSNLAVRKAMAYAIDRGKVSQIGEYGEEPPGNQTGIVTPTFSSWLDSGQATADGNYGYDPAKAEQVLTAAGFHKGSNGIFETKSGTPLSFTAINVGDYSDFVTDMQIVAADFKAVGIGLKVQELSSTAFEAALFDGKYQLAYFYPAGSGPTPFYELRSLLLSANSAPIGTSASGDYERYSSPATDALIASYAAASPAMQRQIVDQLQAVMLKDVPVIPVTEGVDFYEYNTADFSGWVTQGDPYAQPDPAATPDFGWVLLHLAPKG